MSLQAATDLIKELLDRGVAMRIERGRLVCSAPEGVMTQALQDRIRTSHDDIVAWLREAGDGATKRPALERAPRGASFPLGVVQQRLWLEQQLVPDTTVYNVPAVWRLRGTLDVPRLCTALEQIVARHEILRVRIEDRDGTPVQVIEDRVPVEMPVVDVSSEDELHGFIEADRTHAFELEQAPLFRVRLYRIAPDEHVLLFTAHHVIWDAWSFGLFSTELSRRYGALASGPAETDAPPELQFVDFAVWQRGLLESGLLDTQIDYWRDQLRGELPVLDLPSDRPRPTVRSARGGRCRLEVRPDIVRGLRAVGAEGDATLFVVLLAAYNLLLARLSGQRDFVIGVPSHARLHPATADMLGVFVNTLPIRTRFEDLDMTFRDLVAAVRRQVMESLSNQDVPFDVLVERLAVPRSAAYTPLYQTMFVFEELGPESLALSGLRIEDIPVERSDVPTDIVVMFHARDEKLSLYADYSADLFDDETARRFVSCLETLLEKLTADPGSRLGDVDLVPESQRGVLSEWNATRVAYPSHQLLHHLVERQVARTPDAVAVSFGASQLTYRELDQRANQLAQDLVAQGIGPDVPVGVFMDRSLELVVALLGVLKAGGAYLPLDPEYPANRVAAMLEDAHAPIVLTQGHLRDQLSRGNAPVLCVDRDWSQVAKRPSTSVGSRAAVSNAAYIIFTSGSTGRPKGVVNSHAGICNRLLWMQETFSLTPGDRVLQKTPFSFDVSVWEFFWPLMTGARLVMAEPGGHRDPRYLADTIAAEGITTAHFVPSMLQAFLSVDVSACTSLQRIICSGEALPVELKNQALDQLRAGVYNLYGPTEAAVDVTWWSCQREDRSVPIGRPVANTQIHILDERGRQVPIGVPGELYIGGVQVARGYLGRPDLTAERFVPDPFAADPAARLYRTGDLAKWRADGAIEFLGRLDHQVKVRGFRIELGEIESALVEHSAVTESVVVVRRIDGADPHLVAYVVLGSGHHATGSEMRRYLRDRLPEHMVPNMVVQLDALPLSPNGKIDRRALPDPFAEAHVAVKEFEPPTTPTEVEVARIWQSLLGLQRVGRSDNFFELGGHSLLSMRAVAEMQRATGRRLDPRAMFFQTLEQVASQLGNGHAPQ